MPKHASTLPHILLLAVTLTHCAGCASKMPPPMATSSPMPGATGTGLQDSPFKGDQEVLSNQDVEQILAARKRMCCTCRGG